MQGHAKVWIVSAALSLALYGCAGGITEEPAANRAPQGGSRSDPPPFGVPMGRGKAGAGGQSNDGGASGANAGSAGRVGDAAGTGGTSSAGAGGSTVKNVNPAAGSTGATEECPSPTRARLANGQCVDRITEFAVATNPTNIVTGSDKQLWFDDGTANQIVQMNTLGQVLKKLPCDAGPASRELVPGTDDAILWYSDSYAGTLTKVLGTLDRLTSPLGFLPEGMTRGEGDTLWLTEANKAVYRVSPSESTKTRWLASPGRSIVVGPDKNLWFPEGTLIGRLTVAGGKDAFPISDSFADYICPGPDGALWFTDGTLDQIGRMGVDGTFSRTFDLPPGSKPSRIIPGPDGALWFTEQTAIGRITMKGERTHYPVPTQNGLPFAITVGPDGNIWFTELFSGKIGRLIPDPVK